MMIIKLTKEIAGNQLAEELGLDHSAVYADGVGNLIIESDLPKTAIETAIKNHTPKTELLTIQEKLERAGIDLDELRIALGL